jgi:hypothetical protein
LYIPELGKASSCFLTWTSPFTWDYNDIWSRREVRCWVHLAAKK